MVAAVLLRGDDYGPVINVAAAAIAVGTVAALIPARVQDLVGARQVLTAAEPLP